MIEFQHKRKIKKIFYSHFVLLVLLVLLIFIFLQVFNILGKQHLSKDSMASVAKEYDSLAKREKMLKSEIERLKTKEGIEEEIRNKFDVAKPGEQVVVVVDNASGSVDAGMEKRTGWIESFLNLFR